MNKYGPQVNKFLLNFWGKRIVVGNVFLRLNAIHHSFVIDLENGANYFHLFHIHASREKNIYQALSEYYPSFIGVRGLMNYVELVDARTFHNYDEKTDRSLHTIKELWYNVAINDKKMIVKFTCQDPAFTGKYERLFVEKK